MKKNKRAATVIKEPCDEGIVIESGQTKRITIENTQLDVENVIKSITGVIADVRENIEGVVDGPRENVEGIATIGIVGSL
ncbi:22876_t:CDS:2 [Dentiscutata erythropus]|uniref:22876_t:CDS:1 n=1 Tax=Dentiscutata erythropus TaxID=1348616 RepID=A0A9N9FH15_9GLOM|nr:22876_t:CDS:2 [Dentiscutata erythropus]